MKLTAQTLNELMVERPLPTPQNPQGLCLDKGYDFNEVREVVAGLGFTAHLAAEAKSNATFVNWATEPGAGLLSAHIAG